MLIKEINIVKDKFYKHQCIRTICYTDLLVYKLNNDETHCSLPQLPTLLVKWKKKKKQSIWYFYLYENGVFWL